VLSAAAALLAMVAAPTIWQMAHVRSAPDRPPSQAHVVRAAPPLPRVTVPPPATQVVSAPPKRPTKAPRRPPAQKKAPSPTVTVMPEPVQTAEMPETAASLAAIARNDPSLDARIDAIRKLGLLRAGAASQYLVDLYGCEPEPKVRLMIANTLLMQNKPSEVEKLAAREKDPALANTIRATVRDFRARINEEYLAHDRDPGAQPPR
jgi:hypothetical protein